MEKNSQRNFTSSPKKSRAKGKTKQKSNPIKRHEHSEIDNNYSLDLKNIVAIIKPKIKNMGINIILDQSIYPKKLGIFILFSSAIDLIIKFGALPI